ncbi:hypothetical protein [Paractinoplanes rishiriensis]|uniref:Uncharacterized protein n=1 Tax=Paractinoplanes rishiriensis TaxID=1050105 RepID=A0A919N011_9ACTN|nr:hypothetical protein [Actinoplanes rishiriensis]GIE99020.1 hypothetical protein Ari01nite_64850 [Actinoplanes rishiriensis]
MSRAEADATGHPPQAQSPQAQSPQVGPPALEQTEPTGIVGAEAAGSAGGPDAEPTGPPTPPRPPWAGWDPLIRVAGVVVSIVATIVTGVLELFLTPLRAGDFVSIWGGASIGSGRGPVIGLGILFAVVANYLIAWFAVGTTGRRWALGPPWALWTLLMMFAAGTRTPEGDYLLGGDDWVAMVMILAGSLSFAVYAYRMILRGVSR